MSNPENNNNQESILGMEKELVERIKDAVFETPEVMELVHAIATELTGGVYLGDEDVYEKDPYWNTVTLVLMRNMSAATAEMFYPRTFPTI